MKKSKITNAELRDMLDLPAKRPRSYKDNLNMAKQLYRELAEKHPEITDVLNRTGAGNSARVIVALYQQAQLLGRRKGYTK